MIDVLRETYHRVVAETSVQSHRFLFDTFTADQRLCGLIGPRGVGKTTLMLQYIRERIGNGSSGRRQAHRDGGFRGR